MLEEKTSEIMTEENTGQEAAEAADTETLNINVTDASNPKAGTAEKDASGSDAPKKETAEKEALDADAPKAGTVEKEIPAAADAGEAKGAQKGGKKRILYITAGIFLAALLYILAGLPYLKLFLPGTAINGISVSGMSLSKAKAAINANVEQYLLTIEELDGSTEQISGDAIGLAADYGDALDELLAGQNIFSWGIRLFQKKDYSIDALLTCDEEKLSAAINALSCMDKSQWQPAVDAYFEYDAKEGYRIVPEILGTEIDPEKFLQIASDAACSLKSSLSLQDEEIYLQPTVSSDNPEMQGQLALLEPYMDMTVTYLFGDKTEVLAIDTLHDWLSVNRYGRLVIDQECVENYVKELAKKYNTAYQPKTLKTSYGPEVTIKNGFYGWKIDTEGEIEALNKTIRLGKSEEREPVYSQRAASHDDPDYGDTYVEINLTAQHLFYYKDGELVVESDFVSGNTSKGNGTPDGAYALNYKQRDATLKGSTYTSHVSYWMPFNGNIGMHDSSWRSAYGGTIYKTNGSHGCINLPRSAAKTIYENIESGVPVLCYFLDGTERPSDTDASANDPEEESDMEIQSPEADNGAGALTPEMQNPETGNDTEILIPEAGGGAENPNTETGSGTENPSPEAGNGAEN